MKPHVIVVDDKQDLAQGMALVLADTCERVTVCHDAQAAMRALRERPADVLVSDIRMPGMDGLGLLRAVREQWPALRVILLTGYGTIDSAVEAMKAGAFDYLTKPFDNAELVLCVSRAWKEIETELELSHLREELAGKNCFHGIVTRDRRMTPVIDTIRRVGPTHATVLIYGESGTGKELVARAIHAESPRADGPFVAFNAAALPETLVEGELFGAKRGAYTGADRDRKGLIAEADGGTFFIDEVASMPMSSQGKLLRVLQEREVQPLGSATPQRVDVRIVAASNVSPQDLLERGLLRKDLYYRLSVVRVTLPPLRDRVDDIALLAELFLARFAEQIGRGELKLGARAARLLLAHDWPGNVRELQNVMERAAVMCTGDEVGPEHIVFEDEPDKGLANFEQALLYEDAKRQVIERFQRRYLERLVSATDGNLSEAARRAGITRAALYRMMKRLGLDAPVDVNAH